ncbi:MAG: hypothetical protein WCW53_08620 [Syntrophales bacterium]
MAKDGVNNGNRCLKSPYDPRALQPSRTETFKNSITSLNSHSGDGRNPGFSSHDWIPGQARNDSRGVFSGPKTISGNQRIPCSACIERRVSYLFCLFNIPDRSARLFRPRPVAFFQALSAAVYFSFPFVFFVLCHLHPPVILYFYIYLLE